MSKVTDLLEYEKWELPQVSRSDLENNGTTAEKLELLQRQAYEESYEAGYKKGFKVGENKAYKDKINEIDRNNASLTSIVELLTEPLKNLDDEVVEQLADLSISIAKQVIRRELHTEQGEIIAIVREAMIALPASTRKIVLNTHPDDAVLVRNAFSLDGDVDSNELRWKLIEDPLITRGGCKLSGENSRIDATVEARINRVINTLLGGERESDE